MRARRYRPLAVGVFALAVLGACGPARHGTGAASISLSTEGERAAAAHVVLQPGDLAGYDPSPGVPPEPGTVQAATTFADCSRLGPGTLAGGSDTSTIVQSPGFSNGKTAVVSSLAVVTGDDAEARATLSGLSRPDTGGCLTSLFRSVLGLDVPANTPATTELVPGTRVGDQSATWRTTLQLTSGATAYADLSFFRSGRTVVSLFAFQLDEPFPAAERARLLEAMAERTPQA